MVRHKIIKVYSSCCRRQKGKPASCAGCELCGREPALPAFSTDAHTLQCVCAVSCLAEILRSDLLSASSVEKYVIPEAMLLYD